MTTVKFPWEDCSRLSLENPELHSRDMFLVNKIIELETQIASRDGSIAYLTTQVNEFRHLLSSKDPENTIRNLLSKVKALEQDIKIRTFIHYKLIEQNHYILTPTYKKWSDAISAMVKKIHSNIEDATKDARDSNVPNASKCTKDDITEIDPMLERLIELGYHSFEVSSETRELQGRLKDKLENILHNKKLFFELNIP